MDPETEYIIRMLTAALLGGVIGIEREYRAKEAGIRTHFLVSLGSALMMIVSMHGFGDMLRESGLVYRVDPSRMAAQVVSGIGFIGAGAIMMHKQSVRGLTTAAGLWAACGIGLAIGGGMYKIGFAATFLAVAGLELLNILVRAIRKKIIHAVFTVRDSSLIPKLSDALSEAGYTIVGTSAEKGKKDQEKFRVSFALSGKAVNEEQNLFKVLENFENGVKLSKID